MDKNQFVSLIHNYDDVSGDELAELLQLEKKFPFSQTIRSMVAKASITNNKDDAKERLGIAAVYAVDRSILKEFIKGNLEFIEKPAAPQDPVVAPLETAEPEPDIQQTPTKEDIDDDISIGTWDLPENIKDLKPTSDRKFIENLRLEILENLQTLSKYKIENQFMFEDTPVKKTTKTKTKTTGVTQKKTTGKKSTAAKKTTKSKTATKKTTAAKKKAAPKKKTTTKSKSATKKKTTARSSATSKKTTAKKKATTSKATKTKPKTATKKTTTKAAASKKKAKPKSKVAKTKKKEQNELIDQFIESESEIVIQPKEGSDGIDLADNDSSLHEEAVSENLAKIMIQQGKTDKAINIYKKLIWKFPQKKTYFASQIEKLKGG